MTSVAWIVDRSEEPLSKAEVVAHSSGARVVLRVVVPKVRIQILPNSIDSFMLATPLTRKFGAARCRGFN
jgi:hypothetical protein